MAIMVGSCTQYCAISCLGGGGAREVGNRWGWRVLGEGTSIGQEGTQRGQLNIVLLHQLPMGM